MGGSSSKPSSATSSQVSNVRDELRDLIEVTKRDLENQMEVTKRDLRNQLGEEMAKAARMVSGQASTQGMLIRELEYKAAELSSHKRQLARQLEDTRKAADVYQEEAEKRVRAKMEELENTRKAALAFMDAADAYQEAAEKQIKEKAEELEDTRKAALVFMDAADAYQEVAEKKIKEKAEELEDTRKAAMVFMDAADVYQEAAEKQAKEKAEELEDTRKAALVFMDIIADMYQHGHEENVEVLGDQTAVMDLSLESMLLEAIDKLRIQILTAKQKHGVPRAEVVNKISMELGAILVEANKTTIA
ncbi:unnamed protein product [Miscanthus lutarioriparius]|uniref:Uncharacterized protein n=1 Tax=Miscanthus lutarioriparius TaxID=422564 RepID=A0A811RBT6_9POAL|nr:unnamed protein product [Miscanthus lutarioriparius]